MISVKHPLEECNKSQEAFLLTCPAQELRFHELLLAVGNATYHYHLLAAKFNPTDKEFKEWLVGLPEPIRKSIEKAGFEYSSKSLSFTRFVNESHDIGLDDFLTNLVGPQEMEEYHKLVNFSPPS